MSTPNDPGATGTQTWPSASTGAADVPGGTDDKKDQAKQTAGTAADEARQTGAVAKEEAAHVATTARDEAKNVVEESRQQVKNIADEALSQVDDQARVQRDRLVDVLRSVGDDIEKMANGQQVEGGMAKDLARQLADRAHDMGRRMDGREPTELLDEVRSFARRRPGTFLLGALAAGVVAGRVTRGAKDADKQQSSGSVNPADGDSSARHVMGADPNPTATGVAGTAAGDPLAGRGHPQTPPAYPAGSGAGQSGTSSDQPLGQGGTAGSPVAAPQPGSPAQGTEPGGPR